MSDARRDFECFGFFDFARDLGRGRDRGNVSHPRLVHEP